jgi:hypothetical protein
MLCEGVESGVLCCPRSPLRPIAASLSNHTSLQVAMNWEPNAWNERKWIVAQGEGLWKHVDRGKFGI